MSEQMMTGAPRMVTEAERPFWETVARLYREYGTGTEAMMDTYEIRVDIRITASSEEQAVNAAFSALTDAFENYDEKPMVTLTDQDLPYLHKYDWIVRDASIV